MTDSKVAFFPNFKRGIYTGLGTLTLYLVLSIILNWLVKAQEQQVQAKVNVNLQSGTNYALTGAGSNAACPNPYLKAA